MPLFVVQLQDPSSWGETGSITFVWTGRRYIVCLVSPCRWSWINNNQFSKRVWARLMPSTSVCEGVQILHWSAYILQQVLPNLSSTLYHLYRLLRKESLWSWGPKQKTAFEKSKELLTSPKFLPHFDSTLKLTLLIAMLPPMVWV